MKNVSTHTYSFRIRNWIHLFEERENLGSSDGSRKNLSRKSSYELETFVTLDENLFAKSKEIKEDTGLKIGEPSVTLSGRDSVQ